MYTFTATVNYPETREIETPTFTELDIDQVQGKFWRLLSTEPDATSFVITIVKKAE